ncbi:MAG: phospholipid/cholesterol/gamma-HCH transport system substrate-binding protein [Solirubrobacterales bacterium]|nr:phospholipid/cholesterol/gamma-HCH transport system substrate-binding protein [Solirubrobacterales bacterium]
MRANESRRLPSWLVGLVLVIVIGIASILAFTKELPWGDSYEVRAVFASAQNVRPDSPVRIAGVNVGKVTTVEPLTSAQSNDVLAQTGDQPPATTADATAAQQAAVVTMELNQDALPLHQDATFKLRPRLFLEGNYFVDMQPGSPNAPVTDDGYTYPVNQTAYSVQLDQVLTTLQGDVRSDLQLFLDQLGNAFIKYKGAEGFRELYRTSGPAGKYTSQVNQAVLGTEPGDLSGLIRGLDRVIRGLGANEQTLQSLVTNFRVFAGSFAAEDVALGQAIEELPNTLEAARPAFANLNASFPALRAFAREALPGVRSSPETLRAATPYVEQIRALVSERELRGLVADLRPTIPKLATLSQRTLPFLNQSRALASCFNEVVIPWGNDTVAPVDPLNQYPHDAFGRVFEETGYGLSGIASESRSGDSNGQYIRVEGGGGSNTVKFPDAIPSLNGNGFQDAVGLTQFPLLGAMPRLTDSLKTPFKPNQPCEQQDPPNLQAGVGQPPATAGAQAPPLDPAAMLAGLPADQIRKAALQFGLPPEAAKALSRAGEGG